MASTKFYTDIQKLYVAYFNRPADVPGLQYWEGIVETMTGSAATANTAAVSAAFAASAEYKTAYAGMDAYHVVGAVYQNLFGHAADQAGLNFWAQNLMANKFTVDQAVTAIAAGAQGSDLVTYNNRVAAAGAFTSSLDTTAEILAYSTPESLAAAKQFIGTITDNASLANALIPANLDQTVIKVLTPPAPVEITYALSSAAASVDEGGQVTFKLDTKGVAAGTVLSYQITGVDAARVNGATNGTVTVDSNGQAFVTVKTIANLHTDGLSDLTIALANGKASAHVALNDTSLTPVVLVPTYAVSTASASVDEGGQVVFNVNTSNVAAGTVLSYSIGGVDASRIVGATTGTVTVDSNGQAFVTVKTIANQHTDGASNLSLTLANGLASAQVALNDSSLTPVVSAPSYAITSDAASINEGGQVTFKLTTTNVAPGTVLSYTLSGVDAARINGVTAGQVTVDANGQAVVVVKTIANNHTDGATTMQLSLLNGTTSTAVTLVDSSMTPTSFTVDAAQIIASNNSNNNVPVIVTVGDTGNATVTIKSTDSLYAWNGIIVDGNANTTINMGADNVPNSGEKVIVSGSGNTTVNFGQQSSDSLLLGSGNDTININGLTMPGNWWNNNQQVFDGGAGVNTVSVTGTSDLSQGLFAHIQKLALAAGATAKVSVDELANITSVSETDGGKGTLEIAVGTNYYVQNVGWVNPASSIDLSGKLSGLDKLVLDSNVTVTVTAADLAGMTSVTTDGGASITTTVAGAQALLALNSSVSYNISDSAANLAAADPAVFAGSGLQSVAQSGAGTLSIDQAVTVHAAAPGAHYTVAASADQIIKAMMFDATNEALNASQATVVITGTVNIDQAFGLSELGVNASYVLTDTAQHVADFSNWIDFSQVSAVHLSGTTDAWSGQQIMFFATNSGVTVTGLSIIDSAANIFNVDPGTITMASAVSLGTDSVVSVADAVHLKSLLGAKLTGGYSIEDQAVNIVAKPAIAMGATDIIIDGTVGVAIAGQLSALGNSGTTSYVLADSAANLAGATSAVLSHASNVSVLGDVTVAQANAIVSYKVASYSLHDTAANMLSASSGVIAKALAAGGHLVSTDVAISASNAAALYAIDHAAVYSVTDNAANIAAAVAAMPVLNQAVTVKVAGTATMVQAATIKEALGAHVAAYTISDTVAHVLAAGVHNVAALSGASAVTATGSASVAQVAALSLVTGFDGKFAISDTAHNVAVLVASGATGIATLNASTSAVVMSGSVSVADALALKGATTFTNWNAQYDLVDSFANLNLLTAAPVRASAHSVVAEDTIANINFNYAWIKANTSGYIIDDTVANLVTAGNAIVVSGATSGSATDVATAAQGVQLYALNHGVSYNVADSAANLALAANNAGVTHAGTVTLNTAATVAQAQAIGALHAAVAFNLVDSAANLAAAGAAVVLGAAASVTVNTTASAAQATAIVAANAATTLATVADTAAAIQGASSAAVVAAATLVVTDGIRVNLNAAELAHFGEVGGVLTNVTSSAVGRSSNVVHFDVVDTMAHLTAVSGMLADAGKVTVISGGAAVDVVAAATVLGNLPAHSTVGAYAVTGTLVNLLANGATVTGAAAVSTTDIASAAQAKALFTLNSAASYAVSDDVANLALAANSAGVHAATAVTATGITDIATMSAALAANAATTFAAVTFTDTASHLAAAPAGMLQGHAIVATDAATVAQLHAIDAAAGANVAMMVSDTAANVAAGSAAELGAAASVTITTTATAAQGAKLAAMAFHPSFNVSDTAANIIANPTVATVFHGGTTTVTGTATVAQAIVLDSLGVQFKVADTAANLMHIDGWNAIDNAISVTVLGTVDVATAELLSWMGGNLSYDIVDTTAHLVAAVSQLNNGVSGNNLNDLLGNAHSITMDGGATLNLAHGTSGQYYVAGTVAGLKALPAAFLAHGYVVTDSVANIVANFGFAVGSTDGFNIADTGAHLLAAAGSLVNSANNVAVTDVIDAASATAIMAVKASATFALSDTVAHLLANGGATNHASAVTATDAASAVNASSLYSLNNAAKFTVTDSAVNLLASAGGYTHATSVTVTGAATSIAQIDAIKLGNSHVASYSLTDTAAALAATTAKADVTGAAAVVVSGTADGVQAKAIFAANAAAKYSIVDTDTTHLFTGDVLNASTAAATSITGAVVVDVAQALALQGLGAKFAGSFAVTDTAAHLAAATQSMLTLATGVTVTGTANAALATTIAGLHFGTASSITGFGIIDSAANLLLAANVAAEAGHAVEITGTVSVSDATTIDANNGAAAVTVDSLSDNSTNLQLGSAAVVNSAHAINVTDTQTVAQAQFLEANVGTGAPHYSFAKVTDTVSNVLANLGNVVSEATVVTMTGKANIAQAESIAANSALLAKLSGLVGVADTAGNILDAWLDQDFHAVVSGASSVSVTGTASAAQAQVLEGFANVAANSIDVSDTMAAILAAPGVVNLSRSVTATVDADAGRQVFTDAGISTSAKLVYTSSGNLGDAGIVTADAGAHFATNAADILTLKAGDVLNLAAFGLTGAAATAGVITDHTYSLIVGTVTNGGNTFTANAGGNATLVLWDADSTAAVHTAGVILVGQSGSSLVFGAGDATHLGITVA